MQYIFSKEKGTMTMTMTMTHALTMPISEQHTHACRQQKSTFIIYPFSITK
jgi:hypothetical protein